MIDLSTPNLSVTSQLKSSALASLLAWLVLLQPQAGPPVVSETVLLRAAAPVLAVFEDPRSSGVQAIRCQDPHGAFRGLPTECERLRWAPDGSAGQSLEWTNRDVDSCLGYHGSAALAEDGKILVVLSCGVEAGASTTLLWSTTVDAGGRTAGLQAIAPRLGVMQGWSRLTPAGGGTFWLTWIEQEDLSYFLETLRVDAAGRPLEPPRTLAELEGDHQEPTTTVASGELIVAWPGGGGGSLHWVVVPPVERDEAEGAEEETESLPLEQLVAPKPYPGEPRAWSAWTLSSPLGEGEASIPDLDGVLLAWIDWNPTQREAGTLRLAPLSDPSSPVSLGPTRRRNAELGATPGSPVPYWLLWAPRGEDSGSWLQLQALDRQGRPWGLPLRIAADPNPNGRPQPFGLLPPEPDDEGVRLWWIDGEGRLRWVEVEPPRILPV